MGEQEQAIDELENDGVLEGVRWAWESARTQTLRSFMPCTGHDQGWLGYNAYKVLTDRLDRVFSCGRFEVDDTGVSMAQERLLRAGLVDGEFEWMPRLAPRLVVRSDLTGSFGWRYESWRILLQSFGADDVDQIRWSQKSPTKRRVASQPDPDQLPLPEDILDLPVTDYVLGDGFDCPLGEPPVTTLLLAHGIDASSRESELYLGRSHYNGNGERAWYWRVRLDRTDDDRPGEPPAQALESSTPGPFDDPNASNQLSSEENETPR